MSREVRRVPLYFSHPVKNNPHWNSERKNFFGEDIVASKLHDADKRFVPLNSPSYSVAHAEWVREKELWEAGKHPGQEFQLNYHSPLGYLNRENQREEPTPYVVYDESGENVLGEYFFSNIDDLLKYMPYSEVASEPTMGSYMPDFPTDAVLGYCLYETVSEGTPTTPVFATEEELIEHLARYGEDYDQVPLRRSSAEVLVRNGFTVGSFIATGNTLLHSTRDADLIEKLP